MFGETGSPATRGDETGIHPQWDATGLSMGVEQAIELLIIDYHGESNLAQSQIRVSAANRPPTAIQLSNYNVPERIDGAFICTVTASDPDEGDRHGFQVNDDRFEFRQNELWLKPEQ